MVIRILFFGAAADSAVSRNTGFEISDGATAADVIENVKAKHLSLTGQKILFAVNEEYVPADTILKEGDTVAIFTPVSGG